MDRYCPLPFMHIFNDSTNQFDMCCHANTKMSASKNLRTKWNVTKDLPFDFFFSDDMQALRNKMNNNEYVDACNRCYEMDKLNVPSPRKMHLHQQGRLNNIGKVEIKLRMFGSYCNLSCYMCHPNHSSGRRNDLKSLGYDLKDFGYNIIPERHNKISYEKMENHILNNLEHINKIIILGGEPLQVKKFYEFLDKFPDKYAKSIYIAISTNLSKIEFKGHKLEDYIKRFHRLAITISADHFMEKEEWIRWPINFNEFEDNINYINQVISDYSPNYRYVNSSSYPSIGRYKGGRRRPTYPMLVTPTVSVLNVDDLEDIFEYYRTLNLSVGQYSFQYVEYPKHVQPHLHIEAPRIIEKYMGTEFEPVSLRMKNELEKSSKKEIEKQRNNLKEYLDRLSALRGDWRKLWGTV